MPWMRVYRPVPGVGCAWHNAPIVAQPILAFCRNAACAALWVVVPPALADSTQALLDRANADTRVDPEAALRNAEQALTQLATQPLRG